MRSFHRCVILSFFLLTLSPLNAQRGSFLFRHFQQEKSVTYGLNNRRTLLFRDNATIYGGYIGIQFGDNLKHVVTINSTILWTGNDTEHFSQATEVQLNFIGFSEEFIFWKRKRWSFNTYLHFGVGKANARAVNPVLQTSPYDSKWVLPFEAGLQNEYTINSWFSIRSGFGYRYVFNSGDWPLHGMYVKVGAGVKIKELLVALDELNQLRQNLTRRY